MKSNLEPYLKSELKPNLHPNLNAVLTSNLKSTQIPNLKSEILKASITWAKAQLIGAAAALFISSGNLNTARYNGAAAGTQTSGLYFGGSDSV